MKKLFAILLIAVVLVAATAEAQQPNKIYRIGVLTNAPRGSRIEAFRQGMKELGNVEGKHFALEIRRAEEKPDQHPKLAAELVGLPVDVIVADSTALTNAARNATKIIPIVMQAGNPVARGLIASLARPGGNITGSASMTPEIDSKRLELLKELVPRVSRVAVLWNPANPNNAARLKGMQAAAQALRLTLEPVVGVADGQQLDKGFEAIVAAQAEALIMESDRALLAQRARIVDFAAKRRLPALYAYREFVEGGGLASYAPSYPAMFRRAASYVDKILKGAKPADLPVEQPSKFELVINLKTAKVLGLTIPQSLLQRADQVIE